RERAGNAPADGRHDRRLVLVADQVALHEQPLEHVAVLHRQRPIEAPVVADLADVLLGGMAAGQAQRWVATGDDVEDHEHGHRDRDQHGQQAGDAGGHGTGHQPRILILLWGSKASRRASPSTFSETTVSMIAMPGATVSAGAVTIVW